MINYVIQRFHKKNQQKKYKYTMTILSYNILIILIYKILLTEIIPIFKIIYDNKQTLIYFFFQIKIKPIMIVRSFMIYILISKKQENKNHMHKNALIYDDIVSALENNIIYKNGDPTGWDEQSYRKGLWNGRLMIKIGTGIQINENGLKVIVPKDYNMIWLRVSND